MGKGQFKITLLVVGLILNVFGVAGGTTITHTGFVPMTQTNWSSSISIPKFDPVLGSLDSITFTLTGQVQGNAGFENRTDDPATVTLEISAFIRQQRPDASDIWFSFPTASVTESVDPFDGVIDFVGGSGRTYTGLNQNMTSSITTLLPSDLALFTGSGNIILPVIAKGFSSGSGAGSLVLFFETQAAADLEAVYDYTIPEPMTVLLLGLGSLGLVLRRKHCH